MTKKGRIVLILFSFLLVLCALVPSVFAAETDVTLVESGKTRWRYYVTDKNGYARMDAGWYRSGYDVSSWKVGISPFGDRLAGGTDTGWKGENHAIFLVTTFTLDSVPENESLLFNMFYDNTVRIYLNGTMLFQDDGWNDQVESFQLSGEALTVGTNTLAVSLLDDVGGREFDLTVSLTSRSVDATTVAPPITPPETPPESTDVLLVDKARTLWQYRVTTTAEFGKMDAAWNREGFDRSSWKTKVAPFGDILDSSQARVTGWQGDNHGIFLVTTFTVDSLEALSSYYFNLDVFYDNTMSVYLNGTLIVFYDGWSTSFETVALNQKKVLSAIKEGENLLAVSLLDDAGGREFSMSLIATDKDNSPSGLVEETKIREAGLPILRIDTDSGDYITSRLVYVPASMAFDNMESYPKEDNIYTEEGGDKIEIRGRGNSTWNNGYKDGKPGTLGGDTHTRKVGYNIKLSEKVDLFGMGESKKWVLLANYMDRSNLRNRLVADLSGRMGLRFTQSVYVNLILNGEYMGIYSLTEKVDIDLFEGDVTDFEDYAEEFAKAIAKKKGYDKAWRSAMEDELCETLTWLTEKTYQAKDGTVYTVSEYIDLSELKTDRGFLIEYDGYNDEPSFFHTGKGVPLKVSNLEYIKSNPTVFNALKAYFAEFEEALFSDDFHNSKGKHYSEYVDMESFVDYFILNTLILNVEFGYKSMYMAIGQDGKIYLGPTWDYDWSSGNRFLGANGDYNQWYNDGRAGNNHWYRQAYGDPYFVDLVKERYAALDGAIEDMIASMDFYEEYLYPSSVLEYHKFSLDPYEKDFKSRTGGRSFRDEVAQLRSFLINRHNWLKGKFSLRDPNIENFGFKASGITLTLSGGGVDKRQAPFDYQTAEADGTVTLDLTLNATVAKVFVNGLFYREVRTASSPYKSVELMLSSLNAGVNTVTVMAYDASNRLTGQGYVSLVLPGEKVVAPTLGSFIPTFGDGGESETLLSTDTIKAFVQLQATSDKALALRTVFVGDSHYLSRYTKLRIVMFFDTTEGRKTYMAALGKDEDYVLYQTVYADGAIYEAAEGDFLFGNEFHSIPIGILQSVTAVVTDSDGTLLYTGTAKLG